MGNDDEDEVTTFVEHVLLVSAGSMMMEGPIVEDLLKTLSKAMEVPGVLATHLGRSVPILGVHSFIIHIRATDTASCDASCKAAHDAYVNFFAVHGIDTAQEFRNIVIVDFEAKPVGSQSPKWPALRVCVLQFKEDTPNFKRINMEEAARSLPVKFPLVKQVSWGKNIARERMYRGSYEYADVDHHLGFLLAFNSCEDMHTLGNDPEYWDVLNWNGTGILDKYHVYKCIPFDASCRCVCPA